MKNYIKGFTLIELLVVISIIGILATLVVANLNAARSRSRDAVRKADLKNIQTALRLYYNDNNTYPINGGVPFGDEWSSGGTLYMKQVPDDPLSPDQNYGYIYIAADDSYRLSACLENVNDPKCGGGVCSSGCYYDVVP